MGSEIRCKVATSQHKDVGKGIVRIDRKAMRELNVQPRDIVEIIGTKNTAAVVWPTYPEDKELGIIRMDGTIRKNAGVSLGDEVVIRKADVKEARRVIVAPTEPIRFGRDFVEWFHSRLVGRPVVRGDYIKIGILGQELTFVVTATTPAGIVQITEFTEFEVSEKPVKEVSKTAALGVTYEDIGGLKDVIQKVREMIELPLKHPEIFEKLGIEPPKGVLLYGPPGTGKSSLTRTVINESGASAIITNPYELVSLLKNESPLDIIRRFSKEAFNLILVEDIDDLELLSPTNRDLVVSTINLMFEHFKVIGTTSNIKVTRELKLLAGGKFEEVIELKPPDRQGRKEILQIHTIGMPIEPEFRTEKVIEILKELERNDAYRESAERTLVKVRDAKDEEILDILRGIDERLYEEVKARLIDELLDELAEVTHGFVGADLVTLIRKAAMTALRRLINTGEISLDQEEIHPEILHGLHVRKEDFYRALTELKNKK